MKKVIALSFMLFALSAIIALQPKKVAASSDVELLQSEIKTQNHHVEEENIAPTTVLIDDTLDSTFKAYMDYRTITNKESVQYALQQDAATDRHFRKLDGRFMVAIGTGYGLEVGDTFCAVLDNSISIPCIVGDIKQDIHTNETNLYTEMSNERVNVLEFIVDGTSENMKLTGSVSGEFNGLDGNVAYFIIESEEQND